MIKPSFFYKKKSNG